MFGSVNVNAQQPTNLNVFPAVIETNLDPGQSYKTSLVITNNSDKPLPVELEADSLLRPEEVIDIERINEYDASKWIDIEQTSLALEPGETKKIGLQINAPNAAKPGGRYAEIIIKELRLQSPRATSSSAVIRPQIKVPVLANISGEAKKELLLEVGDKFPGFIGFNSTLSTQLTIANTGSTHLLPTVKFLAQKSGDIISSYQYSPGLILPNTKRTFNVAWQPGLPIGIYSLNTQVSYEDGNFIESALEKALVFFPLWIIASLFVVSMVGGFLLAKRHNIKRAVNILLNR